MIAPDPGLARMPLSHPEQGCDPRRLPVLLVATSTTRAVATANSEGVIPLSALRGSLVVRREMLFAE
jgi:hypothetical protein